MRAKKIINIVVPILCIGLAILIHCFFLVYKVNGDSMNPSLHNGDFGVAVKTTISQIDRFNVVIIDTPDKYIIKRVIGLPGETIRYIDGKLYVNDEEVDDKYGNGHTDNFTIRLGSGQYWCLGDNREHSTDSRWYGPFDKSSIMAVIIEKE